MLVADLALGEHSRPPLKRVGASPSRQRKSRLLVEFAASAEFDLRAWSAQQKSQRNGPRASQQQGIPSETLSDAPGRLEFSSDRKVVTFTTTNPSHELCSFDIDCFFTLKLLGTGENVITDDEGNNLDGDGNGQPGGDFQTTFTILG